MDVSKDRREITVNAGYKWQARGGRQISGGSADGVEAEQQGDGRDEPDEVQARAEDHHAAHESIDAVDCAGGERDEEGCGARNVGDGENGSSGEQGAGDGAARVGDLFAHEGAGLAASESEEDSRPEDGVLEAGARDEFMNGETGCRSKMCPGDD